MNHTEVPLNRATRLINHGPTVMISSYDLDKDLTVFMTAQWMTPLDSTLVGVVMDKDSNTLRCIKRFKSFVVNIPSARLRSLVLEAGAVSGSNTNKMATLTSMCGSPLCAVPTTELPSNQPVVLSCSVLDVTNNDQPTEAFLGHISCTLDTEWEVPRSDGSILVVGHITGAKADPTLFLHGFWNFTNESNDLRVTLCHAGADKFFSHKS